MTNSNPRPYHSLATEPHTKQDSSPNEFLFPLHRTMSHQIPLHNVLIFHLLRQ